MKVQTKSELDYEKKELGKLGISKGTGASGNLGSISIVSTGDTMEERGYSGAAVNIARAVEVCSLRRTQVLQ